MLYKLLRKDGVIIYNKASRDFINYKVNIELKRDLRISARQFLSKKIALTLKYKIGVNYYKREVL